MTIPSLLNRIIVPERTTGKAQNVTMNGKTSITLTEIANLPRHQDHVRITNFILQNLYWTPDRGRIGIKLCCDVLKFSLM
jgi:hypothetical protein